MAVLRAAQNEQRVALGLAPIDFDIPKSVDLDSNNGDQTTEIETEIKASYKLFRNRYMNFHLQ